MIDKSHVRELRSRVSAYQRPVLSLYVDMYPNAAENVPQAVHARVKNTLSNLSDVPPAIVERVLERFRGRPPDGRALALFADAERLDTIEIDARFLDDSGSDRVAAHWGKPYLAPLLVGIDEHEPYAVLMAERGTVRVLEVVMGGIEEILAEPNVRYVETPVVLSAREQEGEVPEYLSLKEQGRRIQELIEERDIARVIVIGATPAARGVLSWLPAAVKERVVAVLPGIPEEPAPAPKVLEHVRETIAKTERDQECELLSLIQERGISGVAECLRALQEGRLYKVAYPQALHQDVFCDTRTNYVTLREEDARALSRDGLVTVDLAQKLPSLVEAWGASVEFVGGDAERKLVEELGGMGGLTRW